MENENVPAPPRPVEPPPPPPPPPAPAEKSLAGRFEAVQPGQPTSARITPDHLALVTDTVKRDNWIAQLVEIDPALPVARKGVAPAAVEERQEAQLKLELDRASLHRALPAWW